MRSQVASQRQFNSLGANESGDAYNGRMIAAGRMRPDEAGIPDLGDTGDDSAGEYQKRGLSETGVFDTSVLAHFRDQDNQQRLNNEWESADAAGRAYTRNMYDHVTERARERTEPYDMRNGKPFAPAINAYGRITAAAATNLNARVNQNYQDRIYDTAMERTKANKATGRNF
jgi:hypothetical protein